MSNSELGKVTHIVHQYSCRKDTYPIGSWRCEGAGEKYHINAPDAETALGLALTHQSPCHKCRLPLREGCVMIQELIPPIVIPSSAIIFANGDTTNS